MNFEEFIEWLEAQPERKDPETGETIPARAGAVCRSDEDFTNQKIALEQACALLGSRCTPEMMAEISRTTGNVSQLIKNGERKKKDIMINNAIDPREEFPQEFAE